MAITRGRYSLTSFGPLIFNKFTSVTSISSWGNKIGPVWRVCVCVHLVRATVSQYSSHPLVQDLCTCTPHVLVHPQLQDLCTTYTHHIACSRTCTLHVPLPSLASGPVHHIYPSHPLLQDLCDPGTPHIPCSRTCRLLVPITSLAPGHVLGVNHSCQDLYTPYTTTIYPYIPSHRAPTHPGPM